MTPENAEHLANAVCAYKVLFEALADAADKCEPFDPCASDEAFRAKGMTLLVHLDRVLDAYVKLVHVLDAEIGLKPPQKGGKQG